MHASVPSCDSVKAESPTSIAVPDHVGACSCEPLLRVGRVLQTMAAARSVSDQELLQHIADCTLLMQQAYERYEASANPAERQEAILWMRRRDEAQRSMSPEWKAAREARIQQDITEGVAFFDAQGQLDRARLAEEPGAERVG
jgi:hypothetical protein